MIAHASAFLSDLDLKSKEKAGQGGPAWGELAIVGWDRINIV
jgi:hypothetical protein